MRLPPILHSFSVRLVTGIVVLVLVTTLSAGVPAYWLTRTELERQAWAHVGGAQRSTRSLLVAERERLDNLLALLTERPTLQRLLSEESLNYLPDYLRAFESQTALDFLLICTMNCSATAGRESLPACPQSIPTGFVLYDSRPAIVAALPIQQEQLDEQPDRPIRMAMAGIWMDEMFLRQMALNTGVEQSVLLLDGTRLASTIPRTDEPPSATGDESSVRRGAEWRERREPSGRLWVPFRSEPIRIGDRQYYTDRLSLTSDDGRTTVFLEIALPVDDLFTTEWRALGILAFSTGLISAMGTLLGIWTVRRLTNPLEQLTHAAEAISEGELAAPIPAPSGPSEVRTLATALRKSQASMLAALDDLAQARDWLDNLVQSIVEGVITMDKAGRVTFINEKAADLASFSVEEAIGRDVEVLFSLSDESGNRTTLQQLSLDARHRLTLVRNESDNVPPPRRLGQRSARRLGRPPSLPSLPVTILEVTATRLRTSGSEEALTALILRDITQEESLRHLRAYFLANITHEFRTPLSTLSASMELLMEEDNLNAAEMRELLKPIHLSLVSLQTLIDNLLESSSIEAGRFSIRKEAVDLNEVIAAANRVVQPLLERREQTLALTEPVFLPPLVGDSARLTQVLVNLLNNASKYSPSNTSIDLTVEQIDGKLRLAVADQGPGIPAVDREHLFRRFVRLESTSAEQYGIGLGLHVVKTTIEAHGGHVGIDERPGGGSVFWFELPLDVEHARLLADQADDVEHSELPANWDTEHDKGEA